MMLHWYRRSKPLEKLPRVGDILHSGDLDKDANLILRTYRVRATNGKALILERDDGEIVKETAESTRLRATESALASEAVTRLREELEVHERGWIEKIRVDIAWSRRQIAELEKQLIDERPGHDDDANAIRQSIENLIKLFRLEEPQSRPC